MRALELVINMESGLSQGREPGDDGSGWRGRRKKGSPSRKGVEARRFFGSALNKGVAVLEQRLKGNESDYGFLEERIAGLQE